MDVAGKLLEPRQRATRLHHGGSRKFHRRDSNPDLRLLRRSKASAHRPRDEWWRPENSQGGIRCRKHPRASFVRDVLDGRATDRI